jgi:hypothetical protein
MRNNQFGNMHSQKPYNRMQNTAPKPIIIPSVAAHDFAQYPEPLIGNGFFNISSTHNYTITFILFWFFSMYSSS